MAKTLCDFCKCWSEPCGVLPGHCSERTKESRMACDLTTRFAPFSPIDGYDRNKLVNAWEDRIMHVLSGLE